MLAGENISWLSAFKTVRRSGGQLASAPKDSRTRKTRVQALRPRTTAKFFVTVFSHFSSAQVVDDGPFNFLQKHRGVVDVLDGVFLSVHVDICPMGIAFERVWEHLPEPARQRRP